MFSKLNIDNIYSQLEYAMISKLQWQYNSEHTLLYLQMYGKSWMESSENIREKRKVPREYESKLFCCCPYEIHIYMWLHLTLLLTGKLDEVKTFHCDQCIWMCIYVCEMRYMVDVGTHNNGHRNNSLVLHMYIFVILWFSACTNAITDRYIERSF